MTRGTGAWQAEAERTVSARPRYFMEADFRAAGVFRAWTDAYNIFWNGVTWYGGGDILQFTETRESADRKRHGMTWTLPSRDQFQVRDHLAEAMAAEIGGDAKFWLAWLEPDGALVADPVCLYAGQVANISPGMQDDGGWFVEVQLEQELRDLDRGTRYRMTAASQVRIDPTDQGFQFLPTLEKRAAEWGPKPPSN